MPGVDGEGGHRMAVEELGQGDRGVRLELGVRRRRGGRGAWGGGGGGVHVVSILHMVSNSCSVSANTPAQAASLRPSACHAASGSGGTWSSSWPDRSSAWA